MHSEHISQSQIYWQALNHLSFSLEVKVSEVKQPAVIISEKLPFE